MNMLRMIGYMNLVYEGGQKDDFTEALQKSQITVMAFGKLRCYSVGVPKKKKKKIQKGK